ncbi:MAG TPA: ADP-ribosylglycohydrolase family protein [Bryobacteraceae bacterium]|nr:ADP-ribosylglycohydrolase family protein [Bryobacteraceae bacterium]
MRTLFPTAFASTLCVLASALAVSAAETVSLSRAEYEDRARAAWTAQILGALMGFRFEHKPASTEWVDRLPKAYDHAPVDDDYYYEIVALRAFERYGTGLTVEQLGAQWKENSAGSWGSSEQARLLLSRGVQPPDTGHPRYNKLWFTIGPQFSGDIYGVLAPGLPNLAGRLARDLGHINGFAEGTDGGVFVAGMVSLAFAEDNSKEIVRKAARLIHPQSPYRQCLDLVIGMAEKGAGPREIAQAVEDRWHIEYPATNNAVANGGLVALSVWFGEGDFLKTVNLAFAAADYTDADCNAANAAAVVGAMHGMKALPLVLVEGIHDRIRGDAMGGVRLTPAVDEAISDLARRTVAVGEKILRAEGVPADGDTLSIPAQDVATQPAELFSLADLTRYWNPGWKLERVGFGGAGGGLGGVRGITYLDGDVLATYPRDEVRGALLRRTVRLGDQSSLSVQVAADPGRAWQLDAFAGNERVLSRLIDGGQGKEREWRQIDVDLSRFANREVELRLFQLVLLSGSIPGNAYWRALVVSEGLPRSK